MDLGLRQSILDSPSFAKIIYLKQSKKNLLSLNYVQREKQSGHFFLTIIQGQLHGGGVGFSLLESLAILLRHFHVNEAPRGVI